MTRFLDIKLLLVSAVLFSIMAGSAQGQEPATSKELCEQKVAKYAIIQEIINPDTQLPDTMTTEQEATLKRAMLSSCMLSLKELEENWEKHKDNPGEFFTNYDMIKSVVTEEIFNEAFPNRAAQYTYENMIKSAMAFPFLCGEEGESEETCKREFATMFAHWMQETSGLRYQYECGDYPDSGTKTCGSNTYLSYQYFYNNKSNTPGEYQYWYIGRGPKQLSWNSNYGRFSWALLGDSGKAMEFVEDPSKLLTDEYKDVSFMSAFWFYMTPMSLKPSMHEMLTGGWVPNEKDKAANITAGFGASINIINGGIECDLKGGETKPGTKNRVSYYKGGQGQAGDPFTRGTLDLFGLTLDPNEKLYCDDMKVFPEGGEASYLMYYNRWGSCQMTARENPFGVYESTPMSAFGEKLCENGLDCCRKAATKGASGDMAIEDFVNKMK
ncbi:MAG: hypothetical protein BA863_06550 [Desulfovibrio sp. S3730MH75]|nr:MAG: hypothetical protein BA863_06550 [Desulfovibrio sp. S3730MH75]